MKLLLDENLSDRLIHEIAEFFPDSTHIKTVGLEAAPDRVIWDWARQNGFTIVSKDTDFYHRAIVYGHPPKFIWMRVGNCSSALIAEILRSSRDTIREFIESPTESLLILAR